MCRALRSLLALTSLRLLPPYQGALGARGAWALTASAGSPSAAGAHCQGLGASRAGEQTPASRYTASRTWARGVEGSGRGRGCPRRGALPPPVGCSRLPCATRPAHLVHHRLQIAPRLRNVLLAGPEGQRRRQALLRQPAGGRRGGGRVIGWGAVGAGSATLQPPCSHAAAQCCTAADSGRSIHCSPRRPRLISSSWQRSKSLLRACNSERATSRAVKARPSRCSSSPRMKRWQRSAFCR